MRTGSDADISGGRAAHDSFGASYSRSRRTDPRLAAPLWAALGNARSVVNVGAGAGAYGPSDRKVLAVEPSRVIDEVVDHHSGDVHSPGVLIGYAGLSEPALGQAVRLLAEAMHESAAP